MFPQELQWPHRWCVDAPYNYGASSPHTSHTATGMCLGGHLVRGPCPYTLSSTDATAEPPSRRSEYVRPLALSLPRNRSRHVTFAGRVRLPRARLFLLVRDRRPLRHPRQGQERRLARARPQRRHDRQGRARRTSPSPCRILEGAASNRPF